MSLKTLYKEYKENHLFWLMFVLFFFLWLVSTVIFTSICMINKISITEGSLGAYANILVFDATIFAPIAAYFFYDNWKIQHNAKLYYDLGSEVLKKLKVFTINLASFFDLALNSSRIKTFNFSSTEDKEKAFKETCNEYLNLRDILMKSKADLIHDITFLSYIKEDTNILKNALNQLKLIDDQLNKFNNYIINGKLNRLNEDELLSFIKDDAEIFINLSKPITVIIMNDLKNYIKQ